MSVTWTQSQLYDFDTALYEFVERVSSDGTWGRRLVVLPVSVLEQAFDVVAAPFIAVERLAYAVRGLVGLFFQIRNCEFKDGFMRELNACLSTVSNLPVAILMAPLKILYQVATGASKRFKY